MRNRTEPFSSFEAIAQTREQRLSCRSEMATPWRTVERAFRAGSAERGGLHRTRSPRGPTSGISTIDSTRRRAYREKATFSRMLVKRGHDKPPVRRRVRLAMTARHHPLFDVSGDVTPAREAGSVV